MPGIVNYFEIGTGDPEAAQRFYGGLFEWNFGDPSPVGYRMVNGDRGGLWDTAALGGSSWAIFYVMVEDVTATVAQAEALGATVVLPVTDNGAIQFAHLADPEGNRFGVWKPNTAGQFARSRGVARPRLGSLQRIPGPMSTPSIRTPDTASSTPTRSSA